jgi:predicted permease
MIITRPWFSATVIVTLALSIGMNTTVFTLANAALFKPVPLPGGSRLVAVTENNPKITNGQRSLSYPQFIQFQAQSHSFSGLEASANQQVVIGENGTPPERYTGANVSTGLFAMLQVAPVIGREFAEADGKVGGAPVALIGYGLWKGRYGGAADVVGRTVRMNGVPTTIIGVMPADFRFPSEQDVWTPIVPTKDVLDRTHRGIRLYGRLAPGTSLASAQDDLAAISTRMDREFPDTDKDYGALVQTFQEAFNGGPIRLIFLLMLGAVGFVLLIACANVANMMLSRAQVRSREIALRAALGASRWQLVRQLLVESVLLSIIGGIFGLGIAHYGIHAFALASQDVGKPYWVQFTMDWRVFAYFAAITVLTGIIFGLVPALRASRVDLNTALKDGTAGGTARVGLLSASLVVFQFALTVVLLAGAGVMVQSFIEVQRMNPFVPAAHLLTARVSLPEGKGDRYESVAARRQVHDTLMSRLSALPGVDEAALASDMPGLGSQDRDIEVEGHPNADPKNPARGSVVFATPNYLDTIGLPLLSGRGLNDTDGLENREASVVTRSFAEKFWPGASPLGRRYRFVPDGKPGPWITVVGVCGDIVQDSMDRDPPPLAYLSNKQEPWGWLGLMIRAHGDPSALAASVRKVLLGVDRELPLFEVRTLPEAIGHQYWFLQVFGTLFFLFALMALLMASVGIYAVIAQNTSQRTREIGIRMALGASSSRVLALVLSRGVKQLAIGLAVGLAGAVAAIRLMDSLPGIRSTTNPFMFGLVVLLLLGVGLIACWLPARRAVRIAPTEALRTD